MGSRRLKSTTRKRFRVKIKSQRMRARRHRVRIRATDAAGNSARRVLSFRRCKRPANRG